MANIGTGREVKLNQMIRIMSDLTGRPIEAVYKDPRPGDVLRSCAEVRLAREALGYQPAISFRDGLGKLFVGSF